MMLPLLRACMARTSCFMPRTAPHNVGLESRGKAFHGLVRDRADLAFGGGVVNRDIDTAESLSRICSLAGRRWRGRQTSS